MSTAAAASTRRPDLCVVGAGAAGLSVAAGAARMGARVVLFEAGKMGGDCLNTGCVPSKALLACAHVAATVRDAGRFGVITGAPEIAWETVRAHVARAITTIEPHDSQARFEGLGVEVVRAHAAFEDADTLTGGGVRVQARRTVLAVGAQPLLPPIPGLATVPFVTSDTLWELSERPAHLLVLGGGAIGVEMAHAFSRLGAAVTLVERLRLLPADDPELVDPVRRALVADGVALREGTTVVSAAPGSGDPAHRIRLTLATERGEETIEGSHLLVAVGRAPRVDGLGLDRAGIAHGPAGIVVDRRLRTTQPRVYALGDGITGAPRFTHAASEQAGVLVRRLVLRLPAQFDARRIPHVTYTSPELAQIGLTEAEAIDRLPGHRVLRAPFTDNDRAVAEGDTTGLVKLVIDRSGRLRGAGIVGPGAGELIAPWIRAVVAGTQVRHMASGVLPYPTRSEAGKRAAGSALTEQLFGPKMHRLVRLLAKLP